MLFEINKYNVSFIKYNISQTKKDTYLSTNFIDMIHTLKFIIKRIRYIEITTQTCILRGGNNTGNKHQVNMNFLIFWTSNKNRTTLLLDIIIFSLMNEFLKVN